MRRPSVIKAAIALFAVLFILGQVSAQAHVIANGGTDHSHDGVACAVALVTAEQAVLTPPIVVPQPLNLTPMRVDYALTTDTRPRSFDGRAPPPRGPPALSI